MNPPLPYSEMGIAERLRKLWCFGSPSETNDKVERDIESDSNVTEALAVENLALKNPLEQEKALDKNLETANSESYVLKRNWQGSSR